ncbi:RNA binding protein [Pseudohyphozyma bogoriensis]|nr:RNA binding protein [Pseudohyphozyma bogoriensis]
MLPPTSPLDLRSYSQEQQPSTNPSSPFPSALSFRQPQEFPATNYASIQQPHTSSSASSSSAAPSQPPPSATTPSSATIDRKFSLGLGGVPEHGPPPGLTLNSRPSTLFSPTGTEVTSIPQGAGFGGARWNERDEVGISQESVSSAMSPSASRDGFASGAGLGLASGSAGALGNVNANSNPTTNAIRREIQTDRGGYVRAGYSAEAPAPRVSGGTIPSSGASAGTAGSSTTTEGPVEEISTIFVVGFPEDMLEREFQNMFIFSSGFEAATLKIPASTVAARERDRELATVQAVKDAMGKTGGATSGGAPGAGAGVGPTNVAGPTPSYQDPYAGMLGPDGAAAQGGAYEDAFGNLPLDGAAGTSLAGVMGAGSALSRDSAGSPAGGARKQIIGFAKFKTRAQAFEARDVLSGKKVDAEKGCVLKAEMAKKNLHTKRGLSNELVVGGPPFPLTTLDSATLGRLATASNLNPAVLAELARQSAVHQQSQNVAASTSNPDPFAREREWDRDRERDREATRNQMQQSAAFDAFHSVPAFLPPSNREREHSAGGSIASGYSRQLSSRDFYDDPSTSPTLSSAAYYSLPRQDSHRGYSRERGPSSSPPDYPLDGGAHSPTSSGSLQGPSSPGLRNAMLQSAYSTNSMLQQLDEAPEQHQQPPPHPRSTQPQRQFSNSIYPEGFHGERANNNAVYSPNLHHQFSPPPPPSQMSNRMGPTSPPMGHSMSGGGIPRTQNPADMNAPKNTLYVGGLPAVLPSLTGPFSAAHLEDSLRNVFSRCQGFRRLSFRSKSNGPIVFCEFDDTWSATQAMHDLYGSTLGGLVKGGIRLSYSKNPLGVRGTPNTNGTGAAPGGMSPMVGGQGGDGTFQQNPYGPHPGRRPTESVYGPATANNHAAAAANNNNFDYRSMPRSPPAQSLPQFGTTASSTFAPFSYDHQ